MVERGVEHSLRLGTRLVTRATAPDSVTRDWGVELHRRSWGGPATEADAEADDRPAAPDDASGEGHQDGAGSEEEWGMDA
ncbi:hypothetical protein MHW47_25405 [Streptomyces sp. OfavH-34-F]|uniref:hypothetical protein n=1 Tax=Streptomyces sp. OfavH-34-F TaxID=2917760 RepID=UPI001EF1DCE3|nr:hypothetical protein [Streptomyces sp. OfavH-34-F]MCG7527761.1 hypothetical protein [Streptomyces sp. OfavH-34-F]